MQKQYFALALAAATLTACSSDEFMDDATSSNSGQAVSFSTYLTTRSTDLTNTALKSQSFGVYGYKHTGEWTTNNGVTVPTDSTANFMLHQKVVHDGSVWTYSPIKYWSNEASAHYTFVAYAPYRRISASEISTKGDPKYTYSPVSGTSIDTTTMFDLVSARSLDNTRATNGLNNTVKFQFAHALSRVNIQAKTDQVYYDGTTKNQTLFLITDVKLSGSKFYTSATFNLADNTWSNRTAATSAVSTLAMMDVTVKHPYAASQKDTDQSTYSKSAVELGTDTDLHTLFSTAKDDSQQYLYLVPDSVTSGNIIVTFECLVITFDSALAQGYTLEQETRSITVPQSLYQGKSYNWNFTFSRKGIEFDGEVTDWATDATTPGGNNGNVDEVINEQFYLYNDGSHTWSTATAPAFTNNGDGTHSVAVAELQHFMIGTADSHNTANLYGFYYASGNTTAQGAYDSQKLLQLNTEYSVVSGASAYYIWPANGMDYTPTTGAEDFSNVTVIFNPYKKTVKVVKTASLSK